MTVYTPTQTINVRDLNPTIQSGTTATAPAANASLASISLPTGSALYEVNVYAFVSGTVAAAESNNMVLKQGATTLMALPIAISGTSNPVPVTVVINSSASTTVSVAVGAATPTGTAIYNVSIVARQISS